MRECILGSRERLRAKKSVYAKQRESVYEAESRSPRANMSEQLTFKSCGASRGLNGMGESLKAGLTIMES